MKALIEFCIGVVIMAMLTACASVNSPALSDMSVNTASGKITAQKTSKEEIHRLLGSAQEITFEENGYEIWIYRENNAIAAAANNVLQFVPFLPSVRGTSEIIPEHISKELVILFDRSGVVQKYRVASW